MPRSLAFRGRTIRRCRRGFERSYRFRAAAQGRVGIRTKDAGGPRERLSPEGRSERSVARGRRGNCGLRATPKPPKLLRASSAPTRFWHRVRTRALKKNSGWPRLLLRSPVQRFTSPLSTILRPPWRILARHLTVEPVSGVRWPQGLKPRIEV